jgi:hypothetical protein
MFVTKLLTITKIIETAQMHYTDDECIKKIWYMYTKEHYLTIKNNGNISFQVSEWNWRSSC